MIIPKNLDKLRMVQYPDPILRRKCVPVERFDDRVAALSQRMFELLREHKGVGLAAPQVGISIRMFVCNPTGEPPHDRVIINPRLAELIGAAEHQEGCLSIPNVNVMMRRAAQAVLHAFDLEGHPLELSAIDLEARIWQHEIDHLDGRLIIDNMSSTDEIANRRAIKQLEAEFKARKKSR